MTGGPRRPSAAILLAVGLGVVLGASACVSAPPRAAAPGTTVVAPMGFCDPLRELATDAWTPGDRSRAQAELALAREAAPDGVQPTLDRLLALEGSGVHPGAPGASAEDVGTWFDSMSALADVAERECLVQLAATSPGTTARGTTPSGAGADGALADLVAAVRAAGRGASWVDRGLDGAVATGDSTQVVVYAVDDPAVALTICEDLVAVTPSGARPASVRVRNPAGLVVASTDSGACARDDLQP